MTYYNNLRRRFPTTPDDVLFDGVEDALIYSIRTWSSEGKASFKTWFHRACSMCVYRSWVRYRNGYLADDSGDRKIATRGKANRDCDLFLNETVKFGSTQWEDRCLDRLTIDEVTSCLKPQEKEVLRRVYVYNEKQSDIARAMGISRQRVSIVHKEAIRKCREAAKEGYRVTFKAGKLTPQPRFNVVMAFWRVEWGLKGVFEPNTINYTVEAECWNKAYSKALQERPEIASMLGASEDDVFIRSVTGIMTEDAKCP